MENKGICFMPGDTEEEAVGCVCCLLAEAKDSC